MQRIIARNIKMHGESVFIEYNKRKLPAGEQGNKNGSSPDLG